MRSVFWIALGCGVFAASSSGCSTCPSCDPVLGTGDRAPDRSVSLRSRTLIPTVNPGIGSHRDAHGPAQNLIPWAKLTDWPLPATTVAARATFLERANHVLELEACHDYEMVERSDRRPCVRNC